MSPWADPATDLEDRICRCEALLLEAASARGMRVSGDGRISERDAADLLARAEKSMKNDRSEGRGPRAYIASVGGCRVSYRLRDLAEWVERRREDSVGDE